MNCSRHLKYKDSGIDSLITATVPVSDPIMQIALKKGGEVDL